MVTINPLFMLWHSTLDLYVRFNLDAPLQDRIFKFQEELDEFLGELYGNEDSPSLLKDISEIDKIHLTEEAADVMVTMMGILQKAGVRLAEFQAQMRKVADKNDIKNHDTHVVYNGLITRKSKLPIDN